MASFESLEAKIDSLAAAVAHMQGQVEGKLHEMPCEAAVAMVKELADKHVRPLEDWRQRAMGMIWPALALGGAGAAMGSIEALSRLFR